MKTAVGLSVFLMAFSLNSRAQEIDYDKRNTHIFCSSHLAVISESFDEKGKEYQALAYLSNMHRDEGRKLGATKKHFEDVAGYLKQVRNNSKQKWERLSVQSKKVCLPNS
jgi:ABC-type sulfate transport system substrate-binding protein